MFPSRQRGSALMIALFVITIVALLAAAMSRFLVDSGEKSTVEVRSVRALTAAQSALETGLYQVYPNGKWSKQACPSQTITFPATVSGLSQCSVVLTCTELTSSYGSQTLNGVRLKAVATCGDADLNSSSPDFAVSRTMTVEAYDGASQ